MVGLERLPAGPFVLAFNHPNWIDPFLLAGFLPGPRRVHILGPKEEDMRVGWVNRIIATSGHAVPFRPGHEDLRDATRRAVAVLRMGHILAVSVEGRLSPGEHELYPLNSGAAFLALRSGAPLVPVAINGTRWLRYGKRVRLRIGDPIPTAGRRPDRATLATMTEQLRVALLALLADYPDEPPPGRFWRWFTDVFNER